MAHFAQLNDDNIVVNVIKVSDEQIFDENGNESEQIGIEIFQNQFPGTRWIQTSYNGNIRRVYAGIGMVYLEEHDVFTRPKPYPSWVYDEVHNGWKAPVEKDFDIGPDIPGVTAVWNEETVSWDKVIIPEPIWDDNIYSKFDQKWTGDYWELIPKPSEPDEPDDNVGIAST